MALQMTPFQKNAVDAILARVQLYLDARYLQVRRINAKAEAVWDDLAWLAMSNLRTTLSLDKGWGPDRFHIGETLVGDEVKRIRDCFSDPTAFHSFARPSHSPATPVVASSLFLLRPNPGCLTNCVPSFANRDISC